MALVMRFEKCRILTLGFECYSHYVRACTHVYVHVRVCAYMSAFFMSCCVCTVLAVPLPATQYLMIHKLRIILNPNTRDA